MQLNSTSLTTFELHIDEEVDNNIKLYKWYERSMVRIVNGTKSPDTSEIRVKHDCRLDGEVPCTDRYVITANLKEITFWYAQPVKADERRSDVF